MGHNLGMNHDNGRCSCNGGSCIMAASATGSTLFSDCSASDFERLVLRGGGVCLLNQPSQSNIVSVAKCGNGMLEEGEDCDCGTPQVLSDSPVFLSVLTCLPVCPYLSSCLSLPVFLSVLGASTAC
nr:disintegrin and metalloproteinase domain-containing protein 9-like [Oncorhynchus nerka]